EPEPLERLALAIEWSRVPVLADDELGDEACAVDASVDDLVAAWRADDFGLATLAGEELSAIEPHDDLCGHELDHLGHVVADAPALRSAGRAWPLVGRNRDWIVDAAQTPAAAVFSPGGCFSGFVGDAALSFARPAFSSAASASLASATWSSPPIAATS